MLTSIWVLPTPTPSHICNSHVLWTPDYRFLSMWIRTQAVDSLGASMPSASDWCCLIDLLFSGFLPLKTENQLVFLALQLQRTIYSLVIWACLRKPLISCISQCLGFSGEPWQQLYPQWELRRSPAFMVAGVTHFPCYYAKGSKTDLEKIRKMGKRCGKTTWTPIIGSFTFLDGSFL